MANLLETAGNLLKFKRVKAIETTDKVDRQLWEALASVGRPPVTALKLAAIDAALDRYFTVRRGK